MYLNELKEQLPEYAKDTKLNLSTVLSVECSPNLSLTQIYAVAVCCAATLKDKNLLAAIINTAAENLDEAQITAAKAAANLMAMNNVYYRFTHLVNDAQFSSMPTRLRMNFMANPGVPKIDFELYSLAASALNGCGACMEAHTKHLLKLDVSYEAIQSTVRIAAVVNALNNVLQV